jgi:acetyl esterase/lipase
VSLSPQWFLQAHVYLDLLCSQPCALHDALASYLFLIDPPANSTQPPIPPSSIILSGDSAGAGLCVALLCLIRDSGGKIPMPAGCTMFSPWVDLTHSFKSVVGDGSGDYIPSEGFHYKPSLAWPPILGPENEVNVFLKDPVTGKEKDTTLTEQIQVRLSSLPLCTSGLC